MKKVLFFILVIIACLSLTACDPGSYQFDYDDLLNSVVRIELIDYNNPEQKSFISWVPDHSSRLLPFDDSDLTVLETLDESKIPNFLQQLSEADILYKYFTYDSPQGLCMKLTYNNGGYLIISCNYERKSYASYIGTYTAEGEVIEFIGSFSSYYYFSDLVNDFFESVPETS